MYSEHKWYVYCHYNIPMIPCEFTVCCCVLCQNKSRCSRLKTTEKLIPAMMNFTDGYLNPCVNSASVTLSFPLVTVMSSISLGFSLTLVLMDIDGGLEVSLIEVLFSSQKVDPWITSPREPIQVTSSRRESGTNIAFMTRYLLLIRL